MSNQNTQTLRTARHLLSAARSVLQAYPNVVGVGVGLRRRHGKHTDEVCFIVSVTKKAEVTPRDLLPRRLFGIPVDVEEHASAQMAAAAGDRIERSGTNPFGRIGTIASDGTTTWALTVMHGLGSFTGPASYPYSVDGYFPVSLGTPPATSLLGVFCEGTFSASADIARVAVDASVARTPGPKATDIFAVGLNTGVTITVGGQKASGILTQLPAPPVTVNLGGRDFQIHDAAGFAFNDSTIIPGWSGGPIIDGNGEVLVLLTCIVPSAAAPYMAYGFPLMPYWMSWSLS